jgi:hypothetical protein
MMVLGAGAVGAIARQRPEIPLTRLEGRRKREREGKRKWE